MRNLVATKMGVNLEGTRMVDASKYPVQYALIRKYAADKVEQSAHRARAP